MQNRRAFIFSLAGAGACLASDKGLTLASEATRFSDSATEFVVYRLTDPRHQSWLPASYEHAIARHGNFMLYASDRTGTVQACRMDLKTGQSRVLTEATNLQSESLTLTPDEHSICYFDGRSLTMVNLSNLRTRDVYKIAEGYDAGRGLGLSEDGLYAGIVEQKSGSSRVRLINMRTGSAETLAEANVTLADPLPRPKRAGMLYRRGDDELWLVNFDVAQNHRLRLAPGGLGSALWSTDGRTVLYLNFPADKKQLNNIREFTPDTNEDRFVASTTQFVSFSRNADSSVLVGASGSKASPYVLVLVRSVRRELTLCEHRASDARMVSPVFSPNSQRVFFCSDRDGKMAIYSMVVDRLVEETVTEDKDKEKEK